MRLKTDQYLILLLFVVIVFFMLRTPEAFGMNLAASETVLALMPVTLVTVLSIYGAVRVRGGAAKFGAMIGVGLCLSYLVYVASVEGVVSVEMLSGLTVRQFQVWVVALSAIFGAVVSR